MRNIVAYIVIVLAFFSCAKKEMKDNVVLNKPLVQLKYSELQIAVKDYYEKNLKQYSKGVIRIDLAIKNDTSTFIISSIMTSYKLDLDPPGYYTEVEGLPIILYTGCEKILQFDGEYSMSIMDKITPYLETVPPNYNSPVWRIDIVSDSIVNKVVYN